MHGNAVDAQLCERKLTVIISKMGKAKKHPSRPVKHADDVSAWRMSPETAAPSTGGSEACVGSDMSFNVLKSCSSLVHSHAGVIDRHELYQKAGMQVVHGACVR